MVHSVSGTAKESQADSTEGVSINRTDRVGCLLVAVPWTIEIVERVQMLYHWLIRGL
jgi:hypothetical protein